MKGFAAAMKAHLRLHGYLKCWICKDWKKNSECHKRSFTCHPCRAEYMRQRRKRPDQVLRYKARYILTNAIVYGKIKRGSCEVDGCPAFAEAHHEDYSKPLDVRWLCKAHHWDLHGGRMTLEVNTSKGRYER